MTNSILLSRSGGSRALRVPAAFIGAFCVVLAVLLATLMPARADEQETEYLRIYDNIQQADVLVNGGKISVALAKYQQAHADLLRLRQANPSWNRDMVQFRLNDVAQKAAACADKLKAAPAPASGAVATNAGTQAQPQPKAAVKTVPAAEQPLVTLLAPGAEPRKVLRLQPKAGDKQIVALAMKVAMDQGLLTNLPTVVVTTEIAINSVSPGGDIDYDNAITDITVPADPGVAPQVIEGLKTAFAGLKGLTTTGVISSRGFSKRREVKRPAPGARQIPGSVRLVTEQMETGLTLLTAPLPEEAIGVGGKWEVTTPDKVMNVVTKTLYEIASVEGETVTAKVSSSIATTGQKAESPAAPEIKGEARGEVTIGLTRIMPVAGHIDHTLDLSGAGGRPGQPQKAAFKIKTSLHLENR